MSSDRAGGAGNEWQETARDSGVVRAVAKARSALEVAVCFGEARWPRMVILLAITLEPFTSGMTPRDWTRTLDALETLVP